MNQSINTAQEAYMTTVPALREALEEELKLLSFQEEMYPHECWLAKYKMEDCTKCFILKPSALKGECVAALRIDPKSIKFSLGYEMSQCSNKWNGLPGFFTTLTCDYTFRLETDDEEEEEELRHPYEHYSPQEMLKYIIKEMYAKIVAAEAVIPDYTKHRLADAYD